MGEKVMADTAHKMRMLKQQQKLIVHSGTFTECTCIRFVLYKIKYLHKI